jgi:glycosyltransferase involved in cell wall biosynthesis
MLCVHPSRFAGMPNAVLEAMACGVPVVATAVGGTPEVIDHGRTGWLVQPGDVAATAALLADLLRTPEQRATVGAAARAKVVQHFSLAAMIAGTEALVTRVRNGG